MVISKSPLSDHENKKLKLVFRLVCILTEQNCEVHGRKDGKKYAGKYRSGREFAVFCQTQMRHLMGVCRKAVCSHSEDGNHTTIWNIWYLDST